MTVKGIAVIMSVLFSGGSSDANVVMQGEDNNSVIQQSSGCNSAGDIVALL